jgi:hypothetical protein
VKKLHIAGVAVVGMSMGLPTGMVIMAFMPHGMAVPVYFASCALCIWCSKWLFFDREAELNKKLPISSRQRRENIERFFDTLPRS